MPKDNSKRLIGRKIDAVIRLSDKDCERIFGEVSRNPVMCIMLDDATVLLPLRDAEGNGPGVIEVSKEGDKKPELLWSDALSS